MLNMRENGVATAAALIAVVAVAGGAIGTPLAVDSIDQQPGGPLYGLEMVGERIKELANSDNPNWHLDRAIERTQEYQHVSSGGISNNHANLLEKANDHMLKASKFAKNGKGVQRAREAVQKHIRILENVENKVPDVAKSAVERALIRSRWQSRVLENIENKFGEMEIPPGILRQKIQSMEITWENIKEILENRSVPPGIMEQILENRDIPIENLENFLRCRRLSPGIVRNILRNREITIDNIREFLENIGVLDNNSGWIGPSERLMEKIRENDFCPDNIWENILENAEPPEEFGLPG